MADAPQKLLIVDDEAFIVSWLSTLFRRFGYEVSGAGTGNEALAKMRVDPPDLVLMDVNMPEGNGGEVLRALKSDEDLWIVPVVMMSGDPEFRPEPYLSRGAMACLSKRADAVTLITTVRNAWREWHEKSLPFFKTN
jgi:CheY-like chemotaxis protein